MALNVMEPEWIPLSFEEDLNRDRTLWYRGLDSEF